MKMRIFRMMVPKLLNAIGGRGKLKGRAGFADGWVFL